MLKLIDRTMAEIPILSAMVRGISGISGVCDIRVLFRSRFYA